MLFDVRQEALSRNSYEDPYGRAAVPVSTMFETFFSEIFFEYTQNDTCRSVIFFFKHIAVHMCLTSCKPDKGLTGLNGIEGRFTKKANLWTIRTNYGQIFDPIPI